MVFKEAVIPEISNHCVQAIGPDPVVWLIVGLIVGGWIGSVLALLFCDIRRAIMDKEKLP